MSKELAASGIAVRFRRLADDETTRQQAARRPAAAAENFLARSTQSPATNADYAQLKESVHVLREYCDSLVDESVYLGVSIDHTECSAQAELVVAYVGDIEGIETSPSLPLVRFSRSVRIGTFRVNYERCLGVAEVVENGQVLTTASDLATYLSDTLLQELVAAVAFYRVNFDVTADQPGATQEILFGLAWQQCKRLVDSLLDELSRRAQLGYIATYHRETASRLVAALGVVMSRLADIDSQHEASLLGLDYFELDTWSSLVLPANYAWASPSLRFQRLRRLLAAAADVCKTRAREEQAEAEDYRTELAEKEAQAERAADRANYDVSLEARIERTLQRIENSRQDHLHNASVAEEIGSALEECIEDLSKVVHHASVVLSVIPEADRES